MNYTRMYVQLIKRGQQRGKVTGYTEKHHIIPICMGGKNDAGNLVALTAEEHFVAHQLLVKMHPENKKLKFALRALSVAPGSLRMRNNKQYAWIRKQVSALVSEQMIGNRRTAGRTLSDEHKLKISQAQRNKVVSEETRRRQSEALRGRKITWADKISAAKKGRPISEKQRAVLCEQARKNNAVRNRSPEHKQKCKKALTPEKIALRTQAIKEWYTPERRKEHAEKIRAGKLRKLERK